MGDLWSRFVRNPRRSKPQAFLFLKTILTLQIKTDRHRRPRLQNSNAFNKMLPHTPYSLFGGHGARFHENELRT